MLQEVIYTLCHHLTYVLILLNCKSIYKITKLELFIGLQTQTTMYILY